VGVEWSESVELLVWRKKEWLNL